MRDQRKRARAASLASSLLILTFGLAPVSNAADHRDSPVVTAKGGEADINDLYVFSGRGGNGTILILTVNPGAGVLPESGTTFGTNIDYTLRVDTDLDAHADVIYLYRFGNPNNNGVQKYDVWQNGTWIGDGRTGEDAWLSGGARSMPGLYDDPFFFDLDGFKGSVFGADNGRALCDGDEVNFFAGLNVSAIVLRVPNSHLGGNGNTIGVFAMTQDADGDIIDQMGRPAINTVFNNVEMDQSDRQAFNETKPHKQVARGYRDHTEDVLTALGAADPEGLAGVLIPDTLTFTTGDMSGFLNGRRLADDVIDAELSLVTDGAIPSDCIGNDSDFRNRWPFIAPAN